MKGKNLISYGTIVKAANGDPGAIETVLEHYGGYIRYFSKMDGCFSVQRITIKMDCQPTTSTLFQRAVFHFSEM